MNLVYNLVVETLILVTVVSTVNGLRFEQGVFSMLVGGIILGLLMYGIEYVLGFFKFPKNFWGYLIVGSIFTLIYFILLNTVIVGVINFSPTTIGGSFGPLDFPSFKLDQEIYTVFFSAVYTMLFSLVMNQLSKYR